MLNAGFCGRCHVCVASRAVMARKLKGLDAVISVSVVEPAMTDQGWRFGDRPGANRDDVNRATYLTHLYGPRDSASPLG